MSIKDRIKKLELIHGVDEPHKFIIYTPVGMPDPTPEQEKAYSKTVNWKNNHVEMVLWSGKRFTSDFAEYLEDINEAKKGGWNYGQ
jgi:hypothetical protein